MQSIEALSNNDLDRMALATDRKRVPFTLYRDLAATCTKLWLVKNLLGDAEQSAIYGPPGSGKSVLVEDMSLHVAAGLEWHGRAVKQGAVVYVALERRVLVERRAIAFRERHAIPDLPFAVVGGVYDFRDQRTAGAIAGIVNQVSEATDCPVVLIVIDTVSRALNGGDENSPKDMGALVATTGRLQELTGAHILWVHHVPVDGDRMRGHGALLGALDTTLSVEKLASGLRTASVVKANDSAEGECVSFNLESVEIGPETTAPVVVPAETRQPGPKEPRLTANQQTMYAMLREAGQDGLSAEEWNEMAKAQGIGTKRHATLYDLREGLKAKGLVRFYLDRWNATT